MHVVTSALLAMLLARGATPGADDAAVKAALPEALAHLRAYLAIDTTNPPGNERRGADFFKAIFDREGIACEVLDQGHGRANVLARLPGTGGKRPLVLLNHLDVVPADASCWSVPPFSGELKDGYVWGRGATDMKGTAICQLMTMLLLKRAGRPLERDILFLGTADEEDGAESGVLWMLKNAAPSLRNAEFVLTEGNTLTVKGARTEAWNVDVTEKSVLWLKVVAKGKGGHASIPETDGAVPRLLAALCRIQAFEPEPRVIPAVSAYFAQLAKTVDDAALREDLLHPDEALRVPGRRARLLADPFRNACLRPTISITGLTGSPKVNVLPGEATATIDVRLLPGDDPDAFLARLKAVAADASVKFEVLQSGKATESPLATDLFRAIVRARDRFALGVPVHTPPLTSTTDATKLREAGMVVYGFEPFRLGEDDDRSHGDDERLSVENLRFGMAVTLAVVSDVGGR